ncbi:DUF1800 family protein [Roseivirga sp. BDSF3-8]|uniref:DUF1800 family protein n=1 Tax=Roseivirga sp. BDSF3-8 TaxID=3241598 RepID=UPI003532297E
MPLQAISGTLGQERARHLLRRLTYGLRPGQVEAFASLQIGDALSRLMDGLQEPAHPRLPEDPEGGMPSEYEWVTITRADTERDHVLRSALLRWWTGQMYRDDTALEKLAFFLHTIHTTKSETGGSSRDLYWQNALFRRYLINDLTNTSTEFNRYTHLIAKVIVDNSMLHFLDGRLNVRGRPNENFAREMFELFTIGKGPVRGAGDYTTYTEADIREAARVLTGWTSVNWGTPEAFEPDVATGLPTGKARINEDSGNATNHDNEEKIFSASFNHTIITPMADPPTAESMEDEIRQLVEMIYNQEAAARYFIRRLYRFFVYWDVTEETEQTVIGPLAQTFMSGGYRLRPVLDELFSSEHFFQAAPGQGDDKFGALIKSPLELTLGTLRYFDVEIPEINTVEHNEVMGTVIGEMEDMGLHLMNPYDVAGYEAYHQAPGYNRNWITTNTLAERYAFIHRLLSGQMPLVIDLLAWADDPGSGITDTMATTAVDINGRNYALQLVEHLAGQLLPFSDRDTAITAERYTYFGEYHLGGLEWENWVFNWQNRNGGNMDIMTDATERLKNLFNALMQSPEYQLF